MPITPDVVKASTSIGVGTAQMTALEFQLIDEPIISMTTAATPASGSCAVQLAFKNVAGDAVTYTRTGRVWISSDTSGKTPATVTSIAVLTNGALMQFVAGIGQFVTATGALLGLTITAAAGTYYVNVEMLGGRILSSSACVVNA